MRRALLSFLMCLALVACSDEDSGDESTGGSDGSGEGGSGEAEGEGEETEGEETEGEETEGEETEGEETEGEEGEATDPCGGFGAAPSCRGSEVVVCGASTGNAIVVQGDCGALFVPDATGEGFESYAAECFEGGCRAPADGACQGVFTDTDGTPGPGLQCQAGQGCNLIFGSCGNTEVSCTPAESGDTFGIDQYCEDTTLVAGCSADGTPNIVPCGSLVTGCAISDGANDTGYGFCVSEAGEYCEGDWDSPEVDVRCDQGLSCNAGACEAPDPCEGVGPEPSCRGSEVVVCGAATANAIVVQGDCAAQFQPNPAGDALVPYETECFEGGCRAPADGACQGVYTDSAGTDGPGLQCQDGQGCDLTQGNGGVCADTALTCTPDTSGDTFAIAQYCEDTTLIAGCGADGTPNYVPCGGLVTGCAISDGANDPGYGFCVSEAGQFCLGNWDTAQADVRCNQGLTCNAGVCE